MNRFGIVSLGAVSFLVSATVLSTGCSDGARSGGEGPIETATGSYALVVNPQGMNSITVGAGPGGAVSTELKALLLRAGTECGVGTSPSGNGVPRVSPNLEKSYARLNDTANLDVRKLFSATPVDKCDRVLEQTEALVCMADKLAQISDAVGALRWDRVAVPEAAEAAGVAGVALEDEFNAPWTIPPQAEKDRFIARDLALHVLATAARLEGTALPVGGGAFTCAEVYGALDAQQPTPAMVDVGVGLKELAAAAFDDAWQGVARGDGYMPVSAAAWASKGHDAARPRVMHELKLLRAAGALTKRLVQANVAADAAGAAAKMARAADTRLGAENAWGLQDKYDSLAHAARTLTGRLEIGAPGAGAWFASDMACAGVAATDVAERAYAGTLRGRIEDPTLESVSQVTAATLAGMLGVAIPRAAVETYAELDLRKLYKEQLVLAQAARTGATTATQIDAIRNGGAALAWNAQVDATPRQDLLVGLEYAWATVRMRLGSSMDVSVAAKEAGVFREPRAGEPSVPGAVPVFDEALDRRAVPRNQWSRSIAMAGVGACEEPNGYAQAMGVTAPELGATDRTNWTNNDLDRVPRWVSQDPFSLAQYLERRATVLGARAAAAVSGEADAKAEAARVATELRAWAGPARVFVSTVDPVAIDATGFANGKEVFEVEIQGADAAQLGLLREDLTKATARGLRAVQLLAGSAYEAECAVGQGSACRPFAPERGPVGASGVESVQDATLASRLGVHRAYRWRFMSNEASKAFDRARAGEPLYVLGPDPRQAGRFGILGVVGVPTTWQFPGSSTNNALATPRRYVTSFPVATLQQTALQSVMALPVASTSPQVSGGGAGAPGASCVENQDGLFVPLDNDMIQGPAATEDSWRYWIDRASTLAAEADRYAADLLASRLVVENRKENAAAKLASICGTTGAVSRLRVTNNEIDASGDSALEACLSTKTIDVFTFGQMPTDDPGKRAIFDRVAGDLDCPPVGAANASPVCARLQASTATTASAGLSLSRITAKRKTPACGEAQTSFVVPKSGSATLRAPKTVLAAPTKSLADILQTATTPSGLDARSWIRDGRSVGYAGLDVLSSLQRAQLVQRMDATWSVSVGGSVRLQSDVPPGVTVAQPWPGCLRWRTCNPTNDATIGYAIDALNASFRRCTTGPWTMPERGLTGCEGLASTPNNDQWRAFANDVLWRLEGSIWLGQMLSGGVRAGTFTVPVPLQREWTSKSSLGLTTKPSWLTATDYDLVTTQTDLATLSGSTFTSLGGTSWAVSGGAVTGPVWSIPSAFFLRSSRVANGPNLLPARIRRVYPAVEAGAASLIGTTALVDRMLHVAGTNVGYSSSLGDVHFRASRARPRNGVLDDANYELLLIDLAGFGPANARLETEAVALAKDPASPATVDVVTDRSGTTSLRYASGVSSWEGCTRVCSGGLCTECPPTTTIEPAQLYVYRLADDGWTQSYQGVCTTLSTLDARRGCNPWPQSVERVGANARVRAFVNSTPADSGEERFREFAGAHALGCALASAAMYDDGAMPQPPAPNSEVDGYLSALSGYASKLARRVDDSLGDLYLVNVPTFVAARQDSNPTGGAGMLAEAGTSVRKQLIGVREAAAQMNDTTWELANAVELARIDFKLQDNRFGQRYKELHLRKLRVVEDQLLAPLEAVRDLAKALGDTAWYNPATWAKLPFQTGAIAAITATRMTYNQLELEGLDDLSSLTVQEQQFESTKALKNLYTTAKLAGNKLRSQLAALRQAQLEASQELARYQALQAEAREAAAIASGAQTLRDENGTVQPIPINIVNDRLDEGNFRRYQQALLRAKQAAFYARRAFEQKIGMPLTAITGTISGYDSPRVWIDSVCRTTGLDYKKFRSLGDGDGGVDQNTFDRAQVDAYVDSWIGDYVAKFRSYAEAFLVQYPFTSGDDVALLSMRSQLLATDRGCTEPTRNRVTYSGSLDRIGAPVANQPFRPVIGWQIHPCAAGAPGCLSAKTSALVNLPLGADAGSPVQRDDVTWLQELAQGTPVVIGDAGAPDAGPRDGGVDAGARDAGALDAGVVVRAPGAGGSVGVGADWPTGWISQATTLEAGTYRLTFKDLALDANGNATTSGVAYAVAVFGLDSWGSTLLAPQAFVPSGAWTDRERTFTVSSSGNVRLAFRASVEGAQQLGSVALANVQLEKVEGGGYGALPAVVYQRTQGSLTQPINACNPQSAQRFRELFVKGCESDGRCYWDLATPFRIPVTLLSRADLPEGAPNRTRYNHRLGQLALNVVGSGVRDCEGVADYGTCASAQSVEYTLEHDASGAQLYGLESSAFAAGPFRFSFGVASLSGRAVAAERNFTYLSTADRSIAFAAGAGKSDFDGRPLDADTTFRLRIWDSPELRWDRVDDIQVLLTYRYWSKLRGNSW
jgi:hypothetical protein